MTKLNHKKEQSIVALLHSGMTQVEVAKRYRLARRTIQRVAEKHGDAHALYFGRCGHLHGYNLAKISDCSHNCELDEIVRLLNRPETK